MTQKPTPRCLKVGEEIRRLLSSIFQENMFWDARLRDASLTVTEVRMSPDLKSARIFFIPFGQESTAPVLAALKIEAPRIRKLLASKVRLRSVPEIYFHVDTSYEKFQQVNKLLKDPKVQQDLTRTDADEDNTPLDDE